MKDVWIIRSLLVAGATLSQLSRIIKMNGLSLEQRYNIYNNVIYNSIAIYLGMVSDQGSDESGDVQKVLGRNHRG